MCGITVLFEPTAPPWLPDVARQMTTLVRHRGPDDEGLVVFRESDAAPLIVSAGEPIPSPDRTGTAPQNQDASWQKGMPVALALGHRRLSIVDLSAAGHQPMCDPSRTCWITFNGEIYNFAELRRELEPLGHAFHSGTDTEVILAAFQEWGPSCLARFNGMFAFAIFDCRSRQLFAARDRFGVKPLYYWRTPSGGVAFASEIKQFTAHPQWKASPNGQLAYEFIHWGMLDHTRGTLFAGVGQIRGGEYLQIPLDGLARLGRSTVDPPFVRWYELSAPGFTGTFEEAGIRFRELLEDSVRMRLRADVPVGSCLSGGLDSSSLVCLIRHLAGDQPIHRQKTFSAYSDSALFDERRFAQDVVQQTGADGHSVVPDPDRLLKMIGDLIWTQDEPFQSTSIFAQWSVFELARKSGIVVMLDGQGADEVLGGYMHYYGPRLAGLFARGEWIRLAGESASLHRLRGWSLTTQIRAIASVLFGQQLTVAGWTRGQRSKMIPGYVDMARMGADPSFPRCASASLRSPVATLSRSELTSLGLPMLLHWEDRDSMAHGIEARVPFLDYRLVEFCLGLPEEFKLPRCVDQMRSPRRNEGGAARISAHAPRQARLRDRRRSLDETKPPSDVPWTGGILDRTEQGGAHARVARACGRHARGQDPLQLLPLAMHRVRSVDGPFLSGPGLLNPIP